MKYLGCGHFSDVFDLGNGSVFKAYKRKNVGEQESNQNDNDELTKALYRSELKAYEIIHSEKELSDFFASFYGVADPHELLSFIDGYKEKYVSGCGLIIEYVVGEESKMPHVAPEIYDLVDETLDRANALLSPLGINSYDSSCINIGDGKFKLIDFGLWQDDENYYEKSLVSNLEFSDNERTELARKFTT